jgi:ArsR family transcriptional regulator
MEGTLALAGVSLRGVLTGGRRLSIFIWLFRQEDAMQELKIATRPTRETFAQRARVIKALAHPSRLLIVDELSRGERCVCELTELVGHDISTVSKHLSLLKKSGIVMDEKRGLQVYYRLKTPCVLNFFACIESVIRAGEE